MIQWLHNRFTWCLLATTPIFSREVYNSWNSRKYSTANISPHTVYLIQQFPQTVNLVGIKFGSTQLHVNNNYYNAGILIIISIHKFSYLKSKSFANWFFSLWKAGSCAAAWARLANVSWVSAPLLVILPSTLIPNAPTSLWTYWSISGVILALVTGKRSP